ncbi:MAG: DsbA family protein [Sphingomonas sp.]
MTESKQEGRRDWMSGAFAALLGILIGAGAVGAWYGFRSPDRAATEAIVRDYILAHGEIIPEAMERAQNRRSARSVDRHRSALETPFHGAWAGADDGDVVLVQFFDYSCGYCRQSNADVDRLLREDNRLRVVWRELPVLGPDSEAAARVSLAAAQQGRFRDFHTRMFMLGRPTAGLLQQASQGSGVQPAAETAEMRTELARNIEMARAIGASGTPTFVVGDQVLQGAVGYEALRDAIRQARARS